MVGVLGRAKFLGKHLPFGPDHPTHHPPHSLLQFASGWLQFGYRLHRVDYSLATDCLGGGGVGRSLQNFIMFRCILFLRCGPTQFNISIFFTQCQRPCESELLDFQPNISQAQPRYPMGSPPRHKKKGNCKHTNDSNNGTLNF